MKVLIYYKQSANRDAFEGFRLRKTLKGECENVGIPWVDDKFASPEIAHFISIKDSGLLQRFSRIGVPTVLSAFYCEQEPTENYIKVDGYNRISLKPAAKHMMNQADLVLVPSLAMRKFALENGVTSEVKVAPPCVNPTRFDVGELESLLFLRYFGVAPERKYVLITGNFKEKRKIALVRGLAKALPKLRFYFFGASDGREESLIRHYKYSATENLKFSRVVSDDVYRSALVHAAAYLVLSPLPDTVATLEAFAAKTPVIAMGDQSMNPSLIDGVTATVCKNEAELLAALSNLQEGRPFETSISAFAIANTNNLAKGGKTLKTNYEKLLLKEKEGTKND